MIEKSDQLYVYNL